MKTTIINLKYGKMGVRGGGKSGLMALDQDDLDKIYQAIFRAIPSCTKEIVSSCFRSLLDTLNPESEVNEIDFCGKEILFFRLGRAIELNVQPIDLR